MIQETEHALWLALKTLLGVFVLGLFWLDQAQIFLFSGMRLIEKWPVNDLIFPFALSAILWLFFLIEVLRGLPEDSNVHRYPFLLNVRLAFTRVSGLCGLGYLSLVLASISMAFWYDSPQTPFGIIPVWAWLVLLWGLTWHWLNHLWEATLDWGIVAQVQTHNVLFVVLLVMFFVFVVMSGFVFWGLYL